MDNMITIFIAKDNQVSLNVEINDESVWLTQQQMAELFDRDRTVILRHIKNIFNESELDEKSNVQIMHIPNSDKPARFYSLDVIISVGYRIKSQRGVEFRHWANKVLKEYILQGVAINEERLKQLGQTIKIMKRAKDQLDSTEILNVIEAYSAALGMLDDYDHQRIQKPIGILATYIIEYEECRTLINQMAISTGSELFGKEKDDSFKGSIATIYQTVEGQDIYVSFEEKAANLLYFIVKNHSFIDGNKRIGAAIFLHFLYKNDRLIDKEKKVIEDDTLVALTIMIAESRPQEKETMVKLVMHFLQ